MTRYDAPFYSEHGEIARRSASVVVPLLIKHLRPQSVVDVGCGSGAWLAVFREQGITDVLGIDGEWLDAELLQIPAHCFLRQDFTRPIEIDRRFELVMSLEVAEHLPQESASAFVQSLVSLGDIILFSAAIPDQGGRHHVNEQWPGYWARLFDAHGYHALDYLRPRLWTRPELEWYYAQNLLLFVHEARLPQLSALLGPPPLLDDPLPLVHPDLFHAKLAELRAWIEGVERLASDLARAIPPGASIVLVGGRSLGRLATAGFRVVPLLENDEIDLDVLAAKESALRQLEQLRMAGAEFLVLTWTAFWLRDYYPALVLALSSTTRVVLENSRAVVFDLREKFEGSLRPALDGP